MFSSWLNKLRRTAIDSPTTHAPDAAEARLEHAIEAIEAGRAPEALALCDAVLANAATSKSTESRALNVRGVALLSLGRAPEAESALRQATAIDERQHLYWFNLGNSLLAQDKPAEAVAPLEQALRLVPDHIPSLFNLAKLQGDLKQFDAAIDTFTRIVSLLPEDAGMRTELGIAHFRKGEATLLTTHFNQAMAAFRQVLAQPNLPEPVRHNASLFLGDALALTARHTEALVYFRELLAEEPDNLDALIKCANCLNTLGRMAEAAPLYERAAGLMPSHLPALSSIIVCADYRAEISAEANTRQRFALGARFHDPRQRTHWPNRREPGRRLRIGYVSPDLREHVAIILLEAIWRGHDRTQFEWYVYDATQQHDAKNAQLRELMPNWRDIRDLESDQAVAAIEADEIDILVDLAGHTSGNRLTVFARKPAPVAASWLAYPGSTGVKAIDYLISDALTSPPDTDRFASEEVWRLPGTRFTYEPPAFSPAPALPAADAPITFGCFNNVAKLNGGVFALWQRILAALPTARIVIKSPAMDDASGRSLLLTDLRAAGLDEARVELRGRSNYQETLSQYGQIHVALDPFPFCGGLTSLDALWMGVPVITLEGTLMAGRQTLAFLHNIGHPELVAATQDDYVRLGTDLARDADRLARYRNGLREAMRVSPLLDYAALTRHLEEAYRSMWQRWCAGQPASGH